jgi:hypothetical protein
MRTVLCCTTLAIVAVAALSARATEVIVDNASNPAGNTFTSTGTWIPSTTTTGGTFYGVNFLVHTGSQGAAEATWQPTIPAADWYEVFVRYTQAVNRHTAAAYTVNYDGGSLTVPVNQTTGGGTWVSVGMFPFAAGTSGDVRLDGTIPSTKTVAADAVRWVSLPPAFSDLGSGLAGVSGFPQLTGSGNLAAGSPNSLSLTSAAPSAPALLFVSLTSTPVPFKGGTLVPFPFLLTVPLGTDGSGALLLPFTWPAGVPGDTSFYFQYAIQDAAAIKGAALSNAVKGVAP